MTVRGAVRSDRTFRFTVGQEALWAALTSVDRYRHWWPWLRRFDGGSFSEGARWRCAVRSPLLYPVRFDVVLDEVIAGRSASASVFGDIAGQARLDVSLVEGGSQLRLVSTLASDRRLLRLIFRLAPPVARFGHDRLLATGLRQFRDRAFDR
ncbi:MAG TPA: hypothetical protein VM942_01750 [Acidimicrobiales bacterium]|nr:hypothetical protein [Acidimicrobiales bacterium]